MKIKSLLLGSAAALVAVTGARAADAIVVEAEPMEYVKVCDMYGAGYFYIPGTETCLKFGGAVRVLYTVKEDHDDGTITDHDVNVRLRFNIDAKNETEYGTLTSSARVSWARNEFRTYGDNPDTSTIVETDFLLDHDVESSNETSNGGTDLDYAVISLAGFTVGYHTSRLSVGQFNSKNTGKAFFLDYTYSAGDLALSVGIQDTSLSGAAGQPDPYAKVAYSGEGFDATAWVTLDSSTDNMAYGVVGSMDLSSFIPGGKFIAFWEGDGSDFDAADVYVDGTGTDYVKGHLWGVRMNYKLTDSLSGYSRYSEHSQDGGQWRQSITWAIAPGLALETYYDKNRGLADGKLSLELTRSF